MSKCVCVYDHKDGERLEVCLFCRMKLGWRWVFRGAEGGK